MLPSDLPKPPRGMAVASSGTRALLPDKEQQFKRYVYRGWGYDIFDPDNAYLIPTPRKFIHPDEVLPFVPRPKPKPKKRKPKPKKRKRYVYTPPEPFKLYLVPPLPPDPEPEVEEPEPQYRRDVKPAPGWKPLTGADIDAILEDLE